MSECVVYLMRGLPACGKSTTARRLAGEHGIICETDEYFYLEVGDDPQQYNYSDQWLPAARAWNLERFRKSLSNRQSPIVVDRGNGLNEETREYVQLAIQYGYRVELKEPESEWWQELRVLLKYREFVDGRIFDRWADVLAEKSRTTHRVSAKTIRRWMSAWRHNVTIDDIEQVS